MWHEIYTLSVHSADLLDVRGAPQNVVSEDTVESPGQMKVIQSVIT
jgi:hypothetical protein